MYCSNKLISILLAFTVSLLGSSIAKADCAVDDGPCLALMAAEMSEENDKATLATIALAAAAVGGVWWLVSRDKDEEQQSLVAQFAKGNGIRLTNMASPLNIALMPRLKTESMNFRTNKQSDSGIQKKKDSKKQLGLLRVSYTW